MAIAAAALLTAIFDDVSTALDHVCAMVCAKSDDVLSPGPEAAAAACGGAGDESIHEGGGVGEGGGGGGGGESEGRGSGEGGGGAALLPCDAAKPVAVATLAAEDGGARPVRIQKGQSLHFQSVHTDAAASSSQPVAHFATRSMPTDAAAACALASSPPLAPPLAPLLPPSLALPSSLALPPSVPPSVTPPPTPAAALGAQKEHPAQRTSPFAPQWCAESHHSLHCPAPSLMLVAPSPSLNAAQKAQCSHAALGQCPVGNAGSHHSAAQPTRASERTTDAPPQKSHAWHAQREQWSSASPSGSSASEWHHGTHLARNWSSSGPK